MKGIVAAFVAGLIAGIGATLGLVSWLLGGRPRVEVDDPWARPWGEL